MKLYISGPMTGIPNFNAALFNRVAASLRERGHHVVSPVELDEERGAEFEEGQTHLHPEQYEVFLSQDERVLEAGGFDGVVLLPGWEDSTGAKREGRKAIELGIDLYWWSAFRRDLWPMKWWHFQQHTKPGRAERDYGVPA